MNLFGIPSRVHIAFLYILVLFLGGTILFSSRQESVRVVPGGPSEAHPGGPLAQGAGGESLRREIDLRGQRSASVATDDTRTIDSLNSRIASLNREIDNLRRRPPAASAAELRAIELQRQSFERSQALTEANRRSQLQSERLRQERANAQRIADQMDRDARVRDAENHRNARFDAWRDR